MRIVVCVCVRLVVVCRHHPEPVVTSLLSFLAPSRPFVVYCHLLEVSELIREQFPSLPSLPHSPPSLTSLPPYLLLTSLPPYLLPPLPPTSLPLPYTHAVLTLLSQQRIIVTRVYFRI